MPEEKRDAKSVEIPASLGVRRFGPQARFQQVEKPRDLKGTLTRLSKYFVKEKLLLVSAFLLVLLSSALALAAPYLIGRAVDQIAVINLPALRTTVIFLLSAYVFNSAATLLQSLMMAGLSQRAVKIIRRDLFARMQKLPLLFFDTRSHGDLMSRFSNDVDNISGTISQAIIQIMATVITVTGAFTMMMILSPILTLAALVTVPLVFFLTKVIAGRTRKLFKEQQNTLGALNGHAEETITGIRVIRAFGKEEDEIESFVGLNDSLCETSTKAQILSGFMMPLMEVINNFGITVLALTGGILAYNGMITVGVIASFLGYSRQFTRPLNELSNMFNTLQSAVAGAERVFEVMDAEAETPDKKGAACLTAPNGEVMFKNVNFEYIKGEPVLSEINFTAGSGSRIALVGQTGAGKTTLVNLLTRFYETLSGEITIDGKNIMDYTRESLRKSFGVVLQDTYLFSGTIKENIMYGKTDATDDEVFAAAAAVGADDFIRKLPNGFETLLTESGSNLSQGQRQLLAISRAVLSNAPLLILDEATSNVDTRTERHIQESMKRLMKGRTSFVIAHRLSTIRNADLIMALENGVIAEKGTHAELIKNNGVYAKMYNSQFEG